ncbi:carbohydrate ABC transporter permease [Acidisoma cladoniae]|jgi:glucose/mannose transport system permease protein|uniref:carbohydrate ABC transporter permease n=1 Tax=Acidisoma cladoniae TaxID=3040935 RepID=UPI00254D5CD3|nr:sugar ABC transporter permease [Acidisoma sp. PAMC 29798]
MKVGFNRATAKLVVMPTVFVMVICFYMPILWSAYISFTRSGLFPNYAFAGLVQYTRLLHTARWHTAFTNMIIFGVLFVSFAIVIGTILAILIDQNVRGEAIFRTLLLYPLSMSFIVTGLAWQWFLNPTLGLQHFVQTLGWTSFTFDWIVRRDMSIYTIVIAAVWQSSGLVMAITLAGLRGIDSDIWRASRVEGIPKWRTYWSIVLPMLQPIMVTNMVLLMITVVKSYDLVVAMTQGGPGFSSDVPGKFVVDMAFERGNIGQASAAAMAMLATVVITLAPYLYLQTRRRV